MQFSSDRVKEISKHFVGARNNCLGLTEFPGPLPVKLADAYRCQDAAIKLWHDQVAGWKVGMIHGENSVQFGTDRLVGPIFQSQIVEKVDDGVIDAPIFSQGFGALEAEFVFQLGDDAPEGKTHWSDEEALSLVSSMHAGVEIASSPLISINEIGPLAVVSDFGNNNGLIVGAVIANWRKRLESASQLECVTEIESTLVGRGSAQSIRGGLLASLKFALAMGATRAMPLKAGFYICTGAATGVHRVQVNQVARVRFEGIDQVECRVVAQQPQ